MKIDELGYFKSKPYRNFYTLNKTDKLAIHAIAFLEASEKLYYIENRFSSWWIPAYYLLYHSLELSIKTSLCVAGIEVNDGHSVDKIINLNKNILKFSEEEVDSIQQLENLNYGRGQLRYPNDPKGEFYPNIFSNCRMIIIKVLKQIENNPEYLSDEKKSWEKEWPNNIK